MKRQPVKALIIILCILSGLQEVSYAQYPSRVGTTAANFLEIGYGTGGNAMGDAYVSVVNDLSAVYWNPAGLARMEYNEALFLYQPWIVDINTHLVAVGWRLKPIGTLALGVINVNYGDMEVTSLEFQEGTGEMFSANDMAVSLSYGRQLTTWFSFGATVKYITSNIWHTDATAFAMDLGVIINTSFFSVTGKRDDGLNIGMSVSNYGTRMKYDGIDLVQPIDILPDESGNFRDVPGQFKLQEWELPLFFRLGVSYTPFVMNNQVVTFSLDALHPNNNYESVNFGTQYTVMIPGFGDLSLRGGYKALFMPNSEYGLSLGGGILKYILNNKGIKLDYAFRDIGILGNTHNFSVGMIF